MRYVGLVVALVVATSAQAGNITVLATGQTLENFQEYTHGVETYSQTNVWSYDSFLTVTIGDTSDIQILCWNFGAGDTAAQQNTFTESIVLGPPSYASATVTNYGLNGTTVSTVSLYDPSNAFTQWTQSCFATAEIRLNTINEFGNGDIMDLKFTTAPEPASLILLAIGMLAVGLWMRSYNKQ